MRAISGFLLFNGASDYEFCLRLPEVAEVPHLDRLLYYYRVHPQSISQAKRLEQINTSHRAIQNALRRRRLDDRYQAEVALIGRFSIRRKEMV